MVMFLAIYTNNPRLPGTTYTDYGDSWTLVMGNKWSEDVAWPIYWVSCTDALDIVPIYSIFQAAGVNSAVQDTSLKGWHSATFYPTTAFATLVSVSLEDSLAVVDYSVDVGAPCSGSKSRMIWLKLDSLDGFLPTDQRSWGTLKEIYR